jgi:copper(I)-binding protein
MKRIIPVVILALLGCACSQESAPLVASDVVVTKPMPGMNMTAGYLTLRNNSPQPIIISHVASPQFESVEMHESVVEDGMARMYALGEMTVLAGSSVVFQPGGKHLMLMQPVGEFDTVTLDFFAGEAVVLTINVTLSD